MSLTPPPPTLHAARTPPAPDLETGLEENSAAARRSGVGLDWLNFFTANLQTAFGPFVAVYLTQQRWTQADIGFALSVGSAATMASQVPAGALVDALKQKRTAAGVAIIAIIVGALLLAATPTLLAVLIAEISHGFASCMLTPAIAAISLALAESRRLRGGAGQRLGRNARFASIGNGIAAGLMAVVGSFVGPRAVFVLGAALAVPGLLMLRLINVGPSNASAPNAAGGDADRAGGAPALWRLLSDRRLLWFMACCFAFHLSNAAMLPLAAGAAIAALGNRAELVIGACIFGPQIIVALLSPAVGRGAERWGRRPVLAAGLVFLPLRGMALALLPGGYTLIAIQLMDGVSGAAFGVLLPLVVSDITRGTGRFNLCLGVVGLAIGAAATISTWAAGSLADWSLPAAFFFLAAAGAVAVLLALSMPETRPPAAG